MCQGRRSEGFIVFGGFIVFALLSVLVLGIDLARYELELQEKQAVADDAAILAYRFLPELDRVNEYVDGYVRGFRELRVKDIVAEYSNGILSVGFSSSNQPIFSSLLGVNRLLPIGVVSSTRRQPIDLFVLLNGNDPINRRPARQLVEGTRWLLSREPLSSLGLGVAFTAEGPFELLLQEVVPEEEARIDVALNHWEQLPVGRGDIERGIRLGRDQLIGASVRDERGSFSLTPKKILMVVDSTAPSKDLIDHLQRELGAVRLLYVVISNSDLDLPKIAEFLREDRPVLIAR